MLGQSRSLFPPLKLNYFFFSSRFADIFGLDLQEVKTFTDEIPRIPRRAFQDLDVDMSDYDIGSPRGSTPVFNKFFMPQPQKPQVHVLTALTLYRYWCYAVLWIRSELCWIWFRLHICRLSFNHQV